MTCVADSSLHSHYPSIRPFFLPDISSQRPPSLHRLFWFCSFAFLFLFSVMCVFIMDLIRIISSKVVFLHLFYDDQALGVDHGLCYSTQLLIFHMGKPNRK
ncbi:hypothetical protein CI102_12012 [Trichoderma harzianum]|nr:hypothetical protein CI102_12012 [Trichoderma harzianum]